MAEVEPVEELRPGPLLVEDGLTVEDERPPAERRVPVPCSEGIDAHVDLVPAVGKVQPEAAAVEKVGRQVVRPVHAVAAFGLIPAEAAIDGKDVIVKSSEVANPVAVRYAYTMNPTGANLYNKEGIPASPFRTDDW